MDSKKGRRVTRIEVPTDSIPEFELWQIYSGGGRRGMQEKGRKGNRNRGRRPETSRPGGRKHTQQRKESQKNVQGQIKVTKNRGWRRGGHIAVITFMIQEGVHDQHIPEGLG